MTMDEINLRENPLLINQWSQIEGVAEQRVTDRTEEVHRACVKCSLTCGNVF